MTSSNRFSKLTDNLSPERRARIERCKIELRADLARHELRQALGASQEVLAAQPDENNL